MQYPKPKLKKHNRKKVHDFSTGVKRKEYEDAGGICRTCGAEPITQYHHANEKGMGGGRGLGIQINCIGVGDICHNHSNIDFLHMSNEILEQRIEEAFKEFAMWNVNGISLYTGCSVEEVERQIRKGFLKVQHDSRKGMDYVYTEDIKRWLMGVA
ncbi:MAG: hypothetical protein ACM3KR_00565 [Deltaproteobacteria bacterium]